MIENVAHAYHVALWIWATDQRAEYTILATDATEAIEMARTDIGDSGALCERLTLIDPFPIMAEGLTFKAKK